MTSDASNTTKTLSKQLRHFHHHTPLKKKGGGGGISIVLLANRPMWNVPACVGLHRFIKP